MNARQSQAVRYLAWRDVAACVVAILVALATIGLLYAGLLFVVLLAMGVRP